MALVLLLAAGLLLVLVLLLPNVPFRVWMDGCGRRRDGR